MTLKHIQFNDSPVMRELARQAVKNGTIAAQDVSELVRIAAAKKGESNAPSGDLFADMVRLADGLRSKGYVRNAEVLEEKLLAYKLASSELDKTLSEAHPEGDVEVENAEDDLGTIETLESLHERVMEVVRAQPTAKQAMVKNILKIASEILKGAQEAVSGSDTNPFDSDVGTDRAKETKGKIDKINGEVSGFQTAAIQALTKAMNASVAPTLTANDVNQLNKPLLPFYAELIGVSIQDITSFFRIYNSIFQNGEVSKQSVYNTLKANPESAKNVAHLVNPAIAGRHFPSSNEFQSTTDKALDWAGTIALGPGKAIYDWTKNDSAFASAAGEIYTDLTTRYNSYFSEAQLTAANAKLKALIQTPLTDALGKVNTTIQSVPTLDVTDTSNAKVIDGLNAVIASIESFFKDPAAAAAFQTFTKVKSDGAEAAKSAVLEIAQVTKLAIAKVAATPVDQVGDPLATVDEVQAVAATVMNAGKMLTAWIKSNEGNPQAASAGATVKTLAAVYTALKVIIEKRKSLSYANLMAQLPIKGVESFQKVKELAAQWEQAVSEFVSTEKSAAKLDELIKIAQPVLPGLNTPVAKAPAGGTGKAPSNAKFKPNAKVNPGTGRIEGTLDEDEKKAVMNMQSLIVAIADKKGREDLKRVGKDGGPDPDGAWGPGTAKILAGIQQLMTADKFQGKLWTGVNPNAGYGGTDVAVQKANENSALLTKYLQHIGGTVPNGQSAQNAKNPLLGVIPGLENAQLYYYDIASLLGLYEYAKRAGAEEVGGQNANGEEVAGLPYRSFFDIVSRVYGWMSEVYETSKQKMGGYFQAMQNRMREFGQLVKQFSVTQDGLVTKQMITTTTSKPVGQKGETGAGYVIDPATGKKVPAKPGQVGEGSDVSMSQDLPPPFTKSGDIDLSLDMYYGALTSIFGERMFPLRSFRAYNAEQLAYSLYDDGRSSDVKRDFKGFLNLLSKVITRAMRFYSISGATPEEKLTAERYNMQWRDAIAQLKQQTQDW